MKQLAPPTELLVIARAPFQVYYEGKAKIVSAVNPIGQFDILPGHADFFSVLSPCDVSIDTGGASPITFNITNGIITVKDDQVMLFVNM